MNDYTVSEDYTLKEVMESFERNYDRVSIVVNENNKVIGVVSQGDLIKALASGMSIFTKVGQIMKESFFYLNEKNMEEAYKVVKDKKITLIPIVDKNYILQDVIVLDDIFDYLEKRVQGL